MNLMIFFPQNNLFLILYNSNFQCAFWDLAFDMYYSPCNCLYAKYDELRDLKLRCLYSCSVEFYTSS